MNRAHVGSTDFQHLHQLNRPCEDCGGPREALALEHRDVQQILKSWKGPAPVGALHCTACGTIWLVEPRVAESAPSELHGWPGQLKPIEALALAALEFLHGHIHRMTADILFRAKLRKISNTVDQIVAEYGEPVRFDPNKDAS